MSEQDSVGELSLEMQALEEMGKSNSEAFSIIGTELAELKAMLMALIDLQKSSLFATGVSESELETNVQTLIDGYRERYLNALSQRIKVAADKP